MKITASLLGFFLSTVLVSSLHWTGNNRALFIAQQYVGITEQKPNRGPQIDKWNTHAGVPLGSSYCAAFISFVLDSANVEYPTVRSALAQKYITDKSIKATDVLAGYQEIPAGYLVIWKKGGTWMGHIGITASKWENNIGLTIEANTSPTNKGDQRNGDGVWKKQRRIDPTAYFRITHFTPVY